MKPNHIAIIPDGNRRWAKQKGLPVVEGHRKGIQAFGKLVKKARELKIPVLTLWGFSTENWDRSKSEVDWLMALFQHVCKMYKKDLIKNKVRFIHIGRKDRLPKTLLNHIQSLESETKKFDIYFFILALDYGGCDEIIRAIKRMSEKGFDAKNLSEKYFSQFFDTAEVPYPNPDLVIRTSGEMRLSGFMSWQTQYSELMFVKKHFPDFSPEDFEKCIRLYSKRHRRFGK